MRYRTFTKYHFKMIVLGNVFFFARQNLGSISSHKKQDLKLRVVSERLACDFICQV
jgi:hypothetical protein